VKDALVGLYQLFARAQVPQAGIALPIAALGMFGGLRDWSIKPGEQTAAEVENWETESPGQGSFGKGALPHQVEDGAEGQE